MARLIKPKYLKKVEDRKARNIIRMYDILEKI